MPTRCSRRSSSTTSPPAASLQAITRSRCATSLTALPGMLPRTYSGTLTGDSSPLPAGVPGPLEDVPGEPAVVHGAGLPVELPGHGHPRDMVLAGGRRLRPRDRQPGLSRPVGSRPQAEQPDADDSRQQREVGDVVDERHPAERAAVHAGERDAGLQLPMDEQLEQRRNASRPRTAHLVPHGTTRRRRSNLFVAHNRIHDFSYFLGLHRAELERPGLQLRPDRRRTRRTTRSSATCSRARSRLRVTTPT